MVYHLTKEVGFPKSPPGPGGFRAHFRVPWARPSRSRCQRSRTEPVGRIRCEAQEAMRRDHVGSTGISVGRIDRIDLSDGVDGDDGHRIA